MTKFRINVSTDIYKKTQNCTSQVGTNCAIAEAVRILFPDTWTSTDELIFYTDIEKYFKDYENEYIIGRVPLPSIAIDMINRFDKSSPQLRPFLPEFSFEIEIPDFILEKVIDISQISEILKDCKSLELV